VQFEITQDHGLQTVQADYRGGRCRPLRVSDRSGQQTVGGQPNGTVSADLSGPYHAEKGRGTVLLQNTVHYPLPFAA